MNDIHQTPRLTREELLGYAALLMAIVLFSTIEVAVKMIQETIPPLRLAAIRFILTGLILLLPAARQLAMRQHPFTWADAGVLIGLGLVGVTLAISFYHTALHYLQANVGAIVFSANPVFVAVFAPKLLGEKMTGRRMIAMALGLAGIAVLALNRGTGGPGWVRGILLMTVAQAAFALYSVLSRKYMPRFGAIVITAFAGLIGGALILLLSWATEGYPFVALSLKTWGRLFYITIVATVIPYLLFFYGLVQTGAARGSMFFFLKPVLASAFAYAVLRETLTSGMIAGAALIVGALAMTVIPERRITIPD
jgi:drug/metabolite transporter (DMT)-like permease